VTTVAFIAMKQSTSKLKLSNAFNSKE